MKGVIFLDRDGVIVKDMGYLDTPERIRWMPGIVETLRALQRQGYALVIISNQSGLRRGYFSWQRMHRVQREIEHRLQQEGVRILAAYLCSHHPNERCGCRKPGTVLVQRFFHDFPEYRDARRVAVGDRTSDIEFGQRIGAQTFQIAPQTGSASEHVIKSPRDLLVVLGGEKP